MILFVIIAVCMVTLFCILLLTYRRKKQQAFIRELRDAQKTQAVVIAIQNSTCFNHGRNEIAVQLLLRSKLDDNIPFEGVAIWNVKVEFIHQVQPGNLIPVRLNTSTHHFFPEVKWASHNSKMARQWEKSIEKLRL